MMLPLPALVAIGAVVAYFVARSSSDDDVEQERTGDERGTTSPQLARPELAAITLSPSYTVADLVVSGAHPELAAAIVPTDDQLGAMAALAATVLEPLARVAPSKPTVTSGLRDAALNAAVGGASSSQHLRGQAVDLRPPGTWKAADLLQVLVDRGIPFDQAIAYSPTRGGHLHVSYRADGKNRGELRAAPTAGGYPVVKTPNEARDLLA